jgi:hypothetical protein
MENQTELKWYQKPTGIIILLIVFFPVGLFLMWKNEMWSKKTRWIVTGAIGILFIANAGGSGSADKPKLEEVMPQAIGSWSHEKSRIMGGMKISQFYELSISKNEGEYIYNCKKTVIDEYSGNVPNVSNFKGKLGEIYKTGEFQGKSEFGIKLIGGQFGDKGAYIALGSAGVVQNSLYISFPKGKGDQISFRRN